MLVYHDGFDIVGVSLTTWLRVHSMTYVLGDGGNTNSLTAGQARWELLGPTGSHGFILSDVANMIREHLNENADFARFFTARDTNVADGAFIIEPLDDSGQNGYPTYEGVTIEISFPPLNNPNNMPVNTNGGNISDFFDIPNPNTDLRQNNAVVFEFQTRERPYVPFDPMNPDTTGRYVDDPNSPIIDRVVVGLNDFFQMVDASERVAGLIREGFTRDPTAFWTVTGLDDSGQIIVQSNMTGNYDLSVIVTAPEGQNISDANISREVLQVGSSNTNPNVVGALEAELPYFLVSPPQEMGERAPAYFQPVGIPNVVNNSDRGDILDAILAQAVMTYTNWEVTGTNGSVVTLTTIDDDSPEIPASLRQGNREVEGVWNVSVAAPGNTNNIGLFDPTPISTASMQTVEGRFSLSTTPSYLGVLVTNTSVPGSGLDFLVIEAGDPTFISAQEAINKWIPQIQNAIPRISLVRRANGFFLQPANYDDLASFVLDVRINDTPANAEWIYRIATDGRNPETGVEGIRLNPASDIPLFVNGAEGDNVFDPDTIPAPTDDAYLRAGGPLKVAQRSFQNTAGTIRSTLRLINTTTLIFDIFRPWPRDEINQNLEYPILATSPLMQDEGGVFRRLNKITGADIGWSKPTYTFLRRTVTIDEPNFREIINPGDDFPIDYPSFVERVQLAIVPEFDTEQLGSLALWTDGSTEAFLRGDTLHNQLDIRVKATNYPGEVVSLNVRPDSNSPGASVNLFNIAQDYKVDMRLHGRFLNYRITDEYPIAESDQEGYTHQAEWRLSGMQADIMKGGTR